MCYDVVMNKEEELKYIIVVLLVLLGFIFYGVYLAQSNVSNATVDPREDNQCYFGDQCW